jgi:voltage-gated potassium channel
MRASLIAGFLCLPFTAAFTPRGNVDFGVSSSSNMDYRQSIRPLNSDIGRSPTVAPLSVIDKDAFFSQNTPSNWKQNATGSVSAALQEEGPRGKILLGLPVEVDQELTTDQNIFGAVLKEPLIEVSGFFLVLLSSLLVALSTVNTIDLNSLAVIIRAENLVAYSFAVEFFVRWYTQFTWKGIFQYLVQPLVLVDLLVVILPLIPLLVPNTAAYDVLPNWLFSSGGLVNLRLLRVLRLQRVLIDMDTFADFQSALGIPRTEVKPYKLQLARVVLSMFTLLSISTGLIYSTEHAVNPAIPDYFTALYFGLTTLTTVGFGDITPVTPEGKLVVSGSILAGVAVIPAQAAALVEALLAREDSKQTRATKAEAPPTNNESPIVLGTVCPNCEAGYHWAGAGFCYSCGTKLNDDRS